MRRRRPLRKATARFLDAVAGSRGLFVPPRQAELGAAAGMSVTGRATSRPVGVPRGVHVHGRRRSPALILGYATGNARAGTLPFAGAGAVEALVPFALTWVGVALGAGLLSVFADRIFNLWLPVIPATPGLVVLKRRHYGYGLKARARVSRAQLTKYLYRRPLDRGAGAGAASQGAGHRRRPRSSRPCTASTWIETEAARARGTRLDARGP